MVAQVCPGAAKALEMIAPERSKWQFGRALVQPEGSKMFSKLLVEECMFVAAKLCSTTLCCALLVNGQCAWLTFVVEYTPIPKRTALPLNPSRVERQTFYRQQFDTKLIPNDLQLYPGFPH